MTLGRSLLLLAAITIAAAPAHALTLYFNTDSPAVNAWTTQSIPLLEGNWRVDNYETGAFATAAEVQWVLGHLQGLYVLTEWRTGPDDTNVDNVRFGTGASSTFDTTNEGWFVAGPTPTTDLFGQAIPTAVLGHDGNFGNPLGSVRAGDVFLWTWIGAPSGYLGDQSAQYGQAFNYDIFIRFTDDFEYPALALVAPDMPQGVPEPGTLAFLLLGLGGMALLRRR
jgi:hypothetical protein